MLEFKNISKTYANGFSANKNISFNVEIGKAVGLVGANGSGKTTLLRQLFKILQITEGEILVDGEKDYMGKLSYIPQAPAIYPTLTVFETVYLILLYQNIPKNMAKEMVMSVLSEFDMLNLSKNYVYTLSGGQQKLLAFVCAIAQKKPYIILDEVTAMVDIMTKEKIWELIENKKKSSGILLASHDMMEVKRICDYIVVLKEGKIVYQGKPDELGDLSCQCMIKVDDTNKIVSYLIHKNIEKEVREESIYITMNKIEDMVLIIKEISEITKIKNFYCEHPSFYEEVLSFVKNA